MKILWSAIIPTLNRIDTLMGVLVCLTAQKLSPEAFEILVVDNGSTDTTPERVQTFIAEHPANRIRYLREDIPGLLAGRHRGASVAEADILTFFDDDVEFAPDFALHVLKTFADENVRLAGGPSRPRFEIEPPAWLERYWIRDKEHSECGFISLLDYGDNVREIDPCWIWGLNYSIRKQALYDLGGFHPDIVPAHMQMFQGDGETGLSLAAKERGLTARYVPDLAVTHIIPGERLTEEYFIRRYHFQGVCDSYTEIRRKNGTVSLRLPLPEREEADLTIHTRVRNAYVEGYLFHQQAVLSSPKLLEWVLRPDYWDYAYPELEAGLDFSRPSAKELLESPLALLHDPLRVCALATAYIEKARYEDALRAINQVERAYPSMTDIRALNADALLKVKQTFNKDKKNGGLNMYLFPFEKIEKSANIVLYGAGDVGIDYLEQISKTGYCNIVCVLDKAIASIPTHHNVQVFPPEHISQLTEYDYVLLAAQLKETADGMRRFLIEKKVPEEKILFFEDRNIGTQLCARTPESNWQYHDAIKQKSIMSQYKMIELMQPENLPAIADTGFQVYSQFDEDGILLYIFSLIGFTNRRVVEICAGNGEECNCANLIINHSCHGLLFDGNKKSIDYAAEFYARHKATFLFPPICKHAWITRSNVNQLIEDQEFFGEIDLLSMDIDGNDYWIWEALNSISPRVFICETQNICPDDQALTIPYADDFCYTSKNNYHEEFRSASPLAMIKLSQNKGYRLIGAHKYGFNLIFMRNDTGTKFFPEVPLSEISSNPYTVEAKRTRWNAVKQAPWVRV